MEGKSKLLFQYRSIEILHKVIVNNIRTLPITLGQAPLVEPQILQPF
jgi:hypothetical protein